MRGTMQKGGVLYEGYYAGRGGVIWGLLCRRGGVI